MQAQGRGVYFKATTSLTCVHAASSVCQECSRWHMYGLPKDVPDGGDKRLVGSIIRIPKKQATVTHICF